MKICKPYHWVFLYVALWPACSTDWPLTFAPQTQPASDAASEDAGPVEAGDAKPSDAPIEMSDAATDPVDIDGSDAGSIDDATNDGGEQLATCHRISRLGVPPIIDGQLEPGLVLEPLVDTLEVDPMLPTVRAAVAVAYVPNGLYVYVDVEDANRNPAPDTELEYCGDAVEFFIDDDGSYASAPMYDDPGTVQLVVAAPGDDTQSIRRAARFRDTRNLGAWSSASFAAFPTPRGYAVEALVVAADLDLQEWQLVPGAHVGFNFALDVGGNTEALSCSTRAYQYHLRKETSGSCLEPHCNVASFCTPTLDASD